MILKQHFINTISAVRQVAEKEKIQLLLNWLDHKDANPWILTCLSRATTEMEVEDWMTTSMDTNIAESAHALAQRHGTRLTLVSAIEKGYDIDAEFFGREKAALNFGVHRRHGNMMMTGRTKRSIKRSVTAKKKKQGDMNEAIKSAREELGVLEKLIDLGLDPEIAGAYLKEKISKVNK
jgi:hypothetical protein